MVYVSAIHVNRAVPKPYLGSFHMSVDPSALDLGKTTELEFKSFYDVDGAR